MIGCLGFAANDMGGQNGWGEREDNTGQGSVIIEATQQGAHVTILPNVVCL